MCLVAVAWRAHARYPLVLVGNRDEFHQRPSLAADWWPEHPHLFGGRDLAAGGSWLGITRDGRLAVVTNNPRRPPAPDHTRSRGALVKAWLTGDQEAGAFLDEVQGDLVRYAGFTLLVGSLAGGFEALVHPAGHLGARWRLPAGVSVLSNSPREEPWPKVEWLEQAVTAYLAARAGRDPDPEELLALVGRRMPVAEPEAGTPVARARVTPFVTGTDYGSRASTLVLGDAAGGWRCVERRFGPGGIPAGESSARHFPGAPAPGP
jgi:uncharacterized protein with NRDE domain